MSQREPFTSASDFMQTSESVKRFRKMPLVITTLQFDHKKSKGNNVLLIPFDFRGLVLYCHFEHAAVSSLRYDSKHIVTSSFNISFLLFRLPVPSQDLKIKLLEITSLKIKSRLHERQNWETLSLCLNLLLFLDRRKVWRSFSIKF